MKAIPAVLAVLAVSLLAGCTSSSDDEGDVPQQDAQGRYVIHMTAANRFTPPVAKVPVGATVIWVNDGGVHDVTADDGSWSSDDTKPKLSPGQTYEHTFTEGGKVEYFCALHKSSGMKGTLVVSGEGAPQTSSGTSTSSTVSASVTASSTLSTSTSITPGP